MAKMTLAQATKAKSTSELQTMKRELEAMKNKSEGLYRMLDAVNKELAKRKG